MPSKYCTNCQKIITTGGSAPNFCYYCRRDLSDMPVLPPVIYHSEIKQARRGQSPQCLCGGGRYSAETLVFQDSERLKQLEKLKLEYKKEPTQLKLF